MVVSLFTSSIESDTKMSDKKLNYHEESQAFITVAFNLLDKFKRNPYNCDNDTVTLLAEPYALRINDKGQLSLVKITGCEYGDHTEVIGHAYSNKYTPITHVAKLLTVYLENLQNDRGDNIRSK